jgi:uncharacterized membrane protein YkvA (DUF1232 family)
MPEVAQFVSHGASLITPAITEKVLRNLPFWKVEFAQMTAPLFPHLAAQLEFLADVVEDFAEGADKEVPHYTVAQAVFALMYVHKKVGIIPGAVPELGRADNSSIVRVVLIQNEKALSQYADRHGVPWASVTSKA